MLLDRDGVPWNGYWAAQVLYTDAEGRAWRLPRHWLFDGVSPVIEASRYEVTQELSGSKSCTRRLGGTCVT